MASHRVDGSGDSFDPRTPQKDSQHGDLWEDLNSKDAEGSVSSEPSPSSNDVDLMYGATSHTAQDSASDDGTYSAGMDECMCKADDT